MAASAIAGAGRRRVARKRNTASPPRFRRRGDPSRPETGNPALEKTSRTASSHDPSPGRSNPISDVLKPGVAIERLPDHPRGDLRRFKGIPDPKAGDGIVQRDFGRTGQEQIFLEVPEGRFRLPRGTRDQAAGEDRFKFRIARRRGIGRKLSQKRFLPRRENWKAGLTVHLDDPQGVGSVGCKQIPYCREAIGKNPAHRSMKS